MTHTIAQMLAIADTSANPGLRKMRIALAADAAAKALGLEPRTPPTSKPAKVSQPSRKTLPATTPADADEAMRDYRVCVLVKAGDAQTHVWVAVSAAGPRRAGTQARALARESGHETLGVCATLRDDAPSAILAIAK